MDQKPNTAPGTLTGSPWLDKFVRPQVAAMRGFVQAKTLEALKQVAEVPVDEFVKLNSNENLWGPSPRVAKALGNLNQSNFYPDHLQMEFRELIAKYAGVKPENIVGGAGGIQMIDLVMNIFIDPGDEGILLSPSYDIYATRLTLRGAKIVVIPRDREFNVSAEDIQKAVTRKTKLIVLVNPNNPTGNLMSQKDVIKVLETGIPTLIDEAYYEFCGETSISLMPRFENAIIIRSFSKWAGLAGMRIGYGIFSPTIADQIWKSIPFFSVSAAALVAVRESLEDVEYLMTSVKKVVAERERMLSELQKISFLKPFPSKGCFILCAVNGKEAKDIDQALQSKGILIRRQESPLLKNFIRISIGKPEHTDKLIKVLKSLQ